MPRFRSREDVRRILRVKKKLQEHKGPQRILRALDKMIAQNNGKPLVIPARTEIIKAKHNLYNVRKKNGELFSVGGRPIELREIHAEWLSYRTDKKNPAPSVQANMPMYIEFTARDIFNHFKDLKLTDEIYVIAPGELGASKYKKLNPHKFTIVVNKAIECPVNADLWLACEPLTGRTEWFKEHIKENKDIACFWSHYLYEEYPDINYTYEFGPPLTKTSSECIWGLLRGRATVSAQAFQLAYHLGAKRIVLVGIDLKGNRYFDGSDAGQARPESAWEWILPLFNPLIRWVESKGVEVVTLSETALDVPRAVLY